MAYFRLLTAAPRRRAGARWRRAGRRHRCHPRDLKARLAREIIARLRGEAAAAAAEEHFDRVFRRHETAEDLPELQLAPG